MSQYRLFIGNPGVGKSTLANCIAQRVLFESGMSVGSGKTIGLDKKAHRGVTYLDTPGLADIKMRQSAAVAITDALRQNGTYQIFFVMTLNAGRFRPEDLATIWLVLLNAPDIKVFNIILNKLSQMEYGCLQDSSKKSKLLEPLELIVAQNKFKILLMLNNQMLEDAANKVVKHQELIELGERAPWVEIKPSNVSDVPGDDESFEELLDSMRNTFTNSSDNLLTVQVRC